MKSRAVGREGQVAGGVDLDEAATDEGLDGRLRRGGAADCEVLECLALTGGGENLCHDLAFR